MDLELKGKRAIVTGGSRGIGKAIARQLAREGVDVVITGRNAETLKETAAELSEETGRRVLPVVAESRSRAAIDALVKTTIAELGGLDIIVNNAATPGGASNASKLEEIPDEALLEDVDVKVAGYLRAARAAAPHLIEQGWGRIINIGGLAARKSGKVIASVRNVAVGALTKNLADELGPKGINVVAVHPGATRTERTEPQNEAAFAKNSSIGRIVDSSEVAYVVAFLASPRSVAINGDAIAVGGGSPGNIYY